MTSWRSAGDVPARVSLRRAVRDLGRLVLPVDCGGCGAADVPWCDGCAALLPSTAIPVSGLTVPQAWPVWAGGPYSGVLQRAVLQVKDEGRHDLVAVLARTLTPAVDLAVGDLAVLDPGPPDLGGRSGTTALTADPGARRWVVVPVPSSRAAVRRRGGDVVAGLSRAVASRLRRRGARARVLPAVRQRRGVLDQGGLGAAARQGNLASGLRTARGAVLDGARVLVVDDVVTTGATLAATGRVLEGAGAHVVGAVVVAATPHRGHEDAVLAP